MDWFQDSATRQEHRRLTKMAVAHFVEKYPGRQVNITIAQQEYAEYLGLPSDYFRLYRNGGILTAARVEDALNMAVLPSCPECGSSLSFEAMSGCNKVNPKRYTGLLACNNENCMWHGFTTEGLTDIFNKLRVAGGSLGSVKYVVGVA